MFSTNVSRNNNMKKEFNYWADSKQVHEKDWRFLCWNFAKITPSLDQTIARWAHQTLTISSYRHGCRSCTRSTNLLSTAFIFLDSCLTKSRLAAEQPLWTRTVLISTYSSVVMTSSLQKASKQLDTSRWFTSSSLFCLTNRRRSPPSEPGAEQHSCRVNLLCSMLFKLSTAVQCVSTTSSLCTMA